MSSRSRKRKEAAIDSCPSKRLYSSLAEASLVAKRIREQATCSRERNQVPYLCPNGNNHFHTGRNVDGRRSIDETIYRLRIGLEVDQSRLDYAGLQEQEVQRLKEEYESSKSLA